MKELNSDGKNKYLRFTSRLMESDSKLIFVVPFHFQIRFIKNFENKINPISVRLAKTVLNQLPSK